MCNTYIFSTAKMVTRTLLNIILNACIDCLMLERVTLSRYWQRAKKTTELPEWPVACISARKSIRLRRSAFRGNENAWSLFDTLTRSVQIPEGPVGYRTATQFGLNVSDRPSRNKYASAGRTIRVLLQTIGFMKFFGILSVFTAVNKYTLLC